jgi:hypothetical protein
VKNIGLVSSANGLGHARRLTQLALSFQEKGINPKVFATNKQINNLKLELHALGKFVNFIEISVYGIDGPVWMENGGLIEKPTNNVINSIKECDLIISDNSIWPIKFNDKFVLFGHFNWLDYWSVKGKFQFSRSILEKFMEEANLFKKIKLSLQFKDFKMKGSFDTEKVIPIKLLKYGSDSFFPIKTDMSLAWMAQGTTGLVENLNFDLTTSPSLKLFQKETYLLMNSTYKPAVIFGRPGLGTIRDCLAAGIPFIPMLDSLDPELNSNVNCLEKLTLLPSIKDNRFNLSKYLDNLSLYKDLKESWSDTWQNCSQNCSDICDQILNLSL